MVARRSLRGPTRRLVTWPLSCGNTTTAYCSEIPARTSNPRVGGSNPSGRTRSRGFEHSRRVGPRLPPLSLGGGGRRMPIDAGDGQVGHDRPRCPQQAGEQLDEVVPLLAGGPQHPCQDLPGVGSGRCGCRPHLAAHDRGVGSPCSARQLAAGPGYRLDDSTARCGSLSTSSNARVCAHLPSGLTGRGRSGRRVRGGGRCWRVAARAWRTVR
jgi:hypothetical protein